MGTALYCLKQGLRNIIKNPLSTFASAATVSACIFLFSVFLILAFNLRDVLIEAETNVGITVFFEEGITEEEKNSIRRKTEETGGVLEVRYISADEAWDSFRKTYFGEDYEELSLAFDGENPLESSDSLEIFTESIESQPEIAAMLEDLEGVREVNYASSAVSFLKKMNHWLVLLSSVITGILFAVSVFLISNTVNAAAAFRKRENEIMKLIGAKNYMIRAPFVIEGTLIGAFGTVFPLFAVNILYGRFTVWFSHQLSILPMASLIQEILTPAEPAGLRGILLSSAVCMGVGMGFIVSLLTINRHLRKMR